MRSVLRAAAEALRRVAQIPVPVGNGRLLVLWHRDAEVISGAQTDKVVQVRARLEARLRDTVGRHGIEGEIAP